MKESSQSHHDEADGDAYLDYNTGLEVVKSFLHLSLNYFVFTKTFHKHKYKEGFLTLH
jgi:hypothetical protein